MRIAVTIIIFIIFTSCKSYIDMQNSSEIIDYKTLKFHPFPNYNLLESRRTIFATADSQIYFPQLFDVRIPKKIKTWAYLGNVLYIEYDQKQIIAIDTDYLNNDKQAGSWSLVEDEDLIKRYRQDYFTRNDRNFDYDISIPLHTTTFLYSDGKTKILFYNIKNENFIDFAKVRDTYKYVN